jgi:hypothetical protein
MNLALILILAQSPAGEPTVLDGPDPIWEQIAVVEASVKQTVRSEQSQYTINANDPVIGYYIERVGVVLTIPLRYSPSVAQRTRKPESAETEKNLGNQAEPVQINRRALQKRIIQWQDQMRRQEMLKEANFEKVVTNLRGQIPAIITILSRLPREESLVMVIEERVPAWYYAGFTLNKEATRTVVTLTVDKDLLSRVHASATVMDQEWLDRVKRTTVNRRLAMKALGGDTRGLID